MSRADVVVIGAGVMGASVAWPLTTLGVRDVLLGELLAEIIVHGDARSLDVGALRPGRFADGQPNPAPVLL